MRIGVLVILFVYLSITERILAQNIEPDASILGHRFLNYDNKLPSNLLSSRAAVIISLPPKPGKFNQRNLWKPLAEFAHKAFRAVGIDPVVYYYQQDLLAGKQATESYTEWLDQRLIKNLIFISGMRDTTGNIHFVMVVTPYNGEETLVENGQIAWIHQHDDLEALLKEFNRQILHAEFEKSNFLITEYPEIFSHKKIVAGETKQAYLSDLKIFKLAVPSFPTINVPEQIPEDDINQRIKAQTVKENEQIARDNIRLQQIMQDYPYEFYDVEANLPEEELKYRGIQYVLRYLHTTGHGIRKMLGYDPDPNETVYISHRNNHGNVSLVKIPVDAPVYKFYVKHLNTGKVYVGSKWDADTEWDQALTNFIENMKDELGISRETSKITKSN